MISTKIPVDLIQLSLKMDRYQWNRIESSGINPDNHGQLIFNKGAKTIQWEHSADTTG